MNVLIRSLVVLMCCAAVAQAAETVESLQAQARAALAQIEGQIKIAGLREPVEVLRDQWGVPHIYARNQHDLFFAQGFVAAQDRLFQIDLWRRSAIGETAAVLGPGAVEADRFARLIRYRGDLDAEWKSYSPDTREIAAAFTEGLNAYIEHVGEKLPIEFKLAGFKPGKWRSEDCLGRMSGITMVRNFRQEVARARLVAAVGIEKARWLSPADPVREYGPAAGLDLTGIDARILAGYEAATKMVAFNAEPQGSNNWVVDGTLSKSGKPLMASDPHRALTLPSLRYLVHLHAPGWNVIGGGEPALPGVALGHNEHVAWGFTIAGNDQADLYVEETHPDDATQYRVGDGWKKMEIEREELVVKGVAKPQAVELRFTRHGPVLFQDEQAHRAYVLKWVGEMPGGAAYLGSLALDRARGAEEFVKAIEAWKCPSENIVYADVAGNIGWVAAALTPIRTDSDGLLPVPGAKGHEWQGFIPYRDLPQAANPPERFIATANHNILPPGYTRPIAYEWAPPYRYQRIHQRLKEQSQFSLQDMQDLQHDVISLPGVRLAKLAENIKPDTALLKGAVESLGNWNGSLTAQSHAGAVYGVWLQELQAGLYKPHVPENLKDVVPDNVPVLLAALENPDEKWFGANPQAGRDRLLREAMVAATERLNKMFGWSSFWRWGRLHTIHFPHPLAGLGEPFAKEFNLGSLPRPGDGYAPNATRHNPKFEQVNGATYRHVFDLADWDRGMATSAPGQSGQPGSPHYADLLPLWANGTYFPLVYSRPKVEQHTRHRLALVPKT